MALTDDQKVFTLTITGDPDGSGARDATFEFKSGEDDGLRATHEMRTGYLAQGGSTINALLQGLAGSSESKNKDIVIDGGQSQFTIEVSGTLYNGSDWVWGDDGNGGSATDATGDSAIEQMQVFMNWVRKVPVDSLPEDVAGELSGSYGPAVVEYGQHHPDGNLEPLEVAIENPQFTPRAGGIVDFTLTVVEIASLGDPLDSAGNAKKGNTTS